MIAMIPPPAHIPFIEGAKNMDDMPKWLIAIIIVLSLILVGMSIWVVGAIKGWW